MGIAGTSLRRLVRIPAGAASLEGALEIPERPAGLVVFAHGSGSSRMSPRNRFVATALRHAGFATLLFDLLTEAEDAERERRFQIPLLAERLHAAIGWAAGERHTASLPMGLFGASTGAAAALEVAAQLGGTVGAVVSRGGRPDLARPEALSRVAAPTLLIVGGEDPDVIALNEAAWNRMRCPKQLRIVPGATHLFDEPGALEQVAGLAGDWFRRHLRPAPRGMGAATFSPSAA